MRTVGKKSVNVIFILMKDIIFTKKNHELTNLGNEK